MAYRMWLCDGYIYWVCIFKVFIKKNTSLRICLNGFSDYGVINLIVTVCIHLTVEAGK